MASIRSLYAASQAAKCTAFRQKYFPTVPGFLMEKVRREAAEIDEIIARAFANLLLIDLLKIDAKNGLLWWRYGISVELEHGSKLSERTNVTNDDLLTTAKIAAAHILEFPDYYQRLVVMEHKADVYWKRH